MVSALEGIRVLDITGMGPAMAAAGMLADMGAEVLKIDLPPGGGKRGVGDGLPFLSGSREGMDNLAPFVGPNRNKKSLALNLRTEAGQEIMHRLAAEYDVLLEAFRPGVMERMNVGYPSLSRVNPRLVYCSTTGYGQTGPYRGFPAHDPNAVAMGGALALVGPREDDPPVFPLNFVGDGAVMCLEAVAGIMFALWARQRTGRGQHVDIAISDGATWMLSIVPDAGAYLSTGVLPKRGRGLASGTLVNNTVYETKDGKYITVSPVETHFWQKFCHVVGREDWIPHEWGQGQKQEEMLGELRQVFLTRTRDEWFEILIQADLPAGKVLDMEELVRDPHCQQREMILEFDHPRSGKIRQFGMPIKLSDTPGKVRHLAPPLGQHTDEVLSSLGYPESAIHELRERGVIY